MFQEESDVTIGTSHAPPMLYDYDGFPPESYKYKYAAAGPDTGLVGEVKQLLVKAGFKPQENAQRGFGTSCSERPSS